MESCMALEGCRISSARREISDREEAAYGADEGTLPPCDWPRDPVETDAVRLGPSKWNLITVPMRGHWSGRPPSDRLLWTTTNRSEREEGSGRRWRRERRKERREEGKQGWGRKERCTGEWSRKLK